MNKNYKMRSLFAAFCSKISLGILLLAVMHSGASAQTYCASTNTINTTYHIASVSTTGGITNITNASSFSTGGYADYSAMTAVVIPGNSFTVTATGGPSGYTYMWAIWCDWNHDFDFDDPGETMFTQGTYVATINATFTIPATATGATRMRVRGTFISPVPLACGNNQYAETEDYTLVLPPNNNLSARTFVSPTNDPFCSNSAKDIAVSVLNRGGNAVSSGNINWSVDGVLQTPVPLPTTLTLYNDSTVVNLGSVFFPNTTPRQIKVWTSMPNGVNDSNTSDDSTSKTVTATLLGVDAKATPNDTVICQGNTITLDAGTYPMNPIYIWDNGVLSQTRNVSTAGVYSVKIQNSIGCFDYDTVVVTVHPDPLINSVAVIDNADGSFTFNAIGAQNIFNYTWNFGDGTNDVNGTGNPGQEIHTFANCGDYTVTLTVTNDCGTITTTRQISIDCATSIDNVSALQKQISVFPNPSNSKVTVANKAQVNMKAISLVNVMGQVVYKNDKVNAISADINTSGLAAGIYNVIIVTEKGTITKKLEIAR